MDFMPHIKALIDRAVVDAVVSYREPLPADTAVSRKQMAPAAGRRFFVRPAAVRGAGERARRHTGMSNTRKVHIKSFGCQMNVYDSHRMADTLAPGGYVESASADGADLVILNTCHIREKAVEKVYSEI